MGLNQSSFVCCAVPNTGAYTMQYRTRVEQVEEEKARMRELESVKRHLDGETEDLQNQVRWRCAVTGECTLVRNQPMPAIALEPLRISSPAVQNVFHRAQNHNVPPRVRSRPRMTQANKSVYGKH